MKIVGFHSGHDSAYSILEDGIPTIHNELERFNRKTGQGLGIKVSRIKIWQATCRYIY